MFLICCALWALPLARLNSQRLANQPKAIRSQTKKINCQKNTFYARPAIAAGYVRIVNSDIDLLLWPVKESYLTMNTLSRKLSAL